MEEQSNIGILRNLKDARQLPVLLALHLHNGDVPNSITINIQPTKQHGPIHESWPCGGQSVKHTQYCQVIDVAGQTIHEAMNSRELVQAIHDAFQAHRAAVEKCSVLHLDISTGNIVITREGCGILNDWDMAKIIGIEGAPRPGRTGTWLFMSARMLQNPEKIHEIQDDMESFVHVLIYIALVYTPLRIISKKSLGDLVSDLYYEAFKHEDGAYTGGTGKELSFRAQWIPEQVVFSCTPIQIVIHQLTLYCLDRLLHCDAEKRIAVNPPGDDDWDVGPDPTAAPRVPTKLYFKDHKAMGNLFTKALSWSEDRWSSDEKIEKKTLNIK
ncbi:hypothetical protein BJ138DRAFT_336282 [Hygrophoropsis aurantiaca]|uniref:Uncharacterized protein n=1 Tax=Hygrophoropsis aurantiaca TaxID=72124 RepID=A0ACB8A6E1_9AGAM|nr:hypothetical protein BJ138DRAFT_336282 [Hygrophoropsis aurantiaca]